jgi:hypothetical protein
VKVGDLVKWGETIALVIAVSKAKKTWHRYVTLSSSEIGLFTISWEKAKDIEVLK